jgi:hypothetical protein
MLLRKKNMNALLKWGQVSILRRAGPLGARIKCQVYSEKKQEFKLMPLLCIFFVTSLYDFSILCCAHCASTVTDFQLERGKAITIDGVV